jgi:hypothetical protein
MSLLYDFPSNAAFGRVLPKSKIYEHAAPGSKVKELFVREVEKISWSYKLSPETINLPAKGGVQEIQVFTILLKTGKLSHEVLQTIDKAIPSPVLFVVSSGKQVRYVAAYKRPSEADKSKWVVSSYFETGWVNKDAERVELPVVLDMGTLYRTILKNIIQLPAREEETIDELVTRVDRLQILEREVAKVQTRLKKEKQFNRMVKINAEMRSLKQEIEALTR